ncbi:MAG: Gfo/Idh/MocA family protein [Bryobacteraceae bacterium]
MRGAGKEKLKAGLIGVGGRGRQAVVDLLTGTENVEVVALGDLFEDKLESNLAWMRDASAHPRIQDRLKVDAEHRFTGFDAYKKVIASGVDIVMLCTPPVYRPIHFEAAVEANKHVFCEKPFGTDPVGVRRFMAAARKSEQKKLTVMAGAQRRSNPAYIETVRKIHDGAIGDIVAAYAQWIGGPVIKEKDRNPKWGDTTWQHRNWYAYAWICGDQIVEQHLHNIDAINWVMGAHPDRVVASGGAAWRPREPAYGNIYDHIYADFTYPNGAHLSSHCRQYPAGCYGNIGERRGERTGENVVGTKGRSNCRDLAGDVKRQFTPYVQEHIEMVRSIRGEGPYINLAMAVAESTMTCIMGRESAYSGLEITWDMIMKSQLDLLPKVLSYDAKLEVPPLPVPGVYKFI